VSLAQLADLVVLAEDAAQITAGEEDRAAAAPAAQAVFLAAVGKEAGDDGVAANPADGPLVLQPVNATITRADYSPLSKRSTTAQPIRPT
jgi:hypothetical protein